MSLRVATICSGIGAPEKALTLLGIHYKLVFFSEIDKWAEKSYCSIHGIDSKLNIGDLKDYRHYNLPKDIDLIVGGTPCQDFSPAGKGKGGEQGSGTRSSLMWDYIRLIKEIKPKIIVWENVAAVINKKHFKVYKKFYFALSALGYKLKAKTLNAKLFGVPQNRERLFLVAMRKDIAWDFEFPQGFDSGVRLKNILQAHIPKKLFVNSAKFRLYKPNTNYPTHRIIYCGALLNRHYKQGNQVISDCGINGCLTTRKADFIYDSRYNSIRYLSGLEHVRLMGFKDEDYLKCKSVSVSENEIIKQAGNSIVVNVLMALFGQMFQVEWRKKIFGKATQNNYAAIPLFKGVYENKQNI